VARSFERASSARIQQRFRLAKLAGGDRVGAQSRRELHEQQRRWLRARWHLILMVAAVAGLMAAAVHSLVWAPAAPYVVGATLASSAWWVYTMMLETGGISSKRAGVTAEEWTASELRPFGRHGWRLVNHVMIQKSNVDHALLGPGGFIAVETKFRSDWSAAARDLTAMAWQAKQAARDLQARLRVWKPLVRPVVVMWGPELRQHFATVFERDGVTFCPGHLLHDFVASLPAEIEVHDVQKAYTNLDEYVRRRDSGEVQEMGDLPRTITEALHDSIFVTASVVLSALVVLPPAGLAPAGLWCMVAVGLLVAGGMVSRRKWSRDVRMQRVTTSIIATSAGLGCLLGAAELFFITR
jgi:hypothetical protein